LSRKRAEVPDVVVTQAHERSGSGPTRCPPSLQESVARGRLSGGSRRGGLAIAGAGAGDGGETGAGGRQRDEGGGGGGGGGGGPGPQADRLDVDLSAAVKDVGQWSDPGQWCADECAGDQGQPGESGQVADRGEGVVAEPGEPQQPGCGQDERGHLDQPQPGRGPGG